MTRTEATYILHAINRSKILRPGWRAERVKQIRFDYLPAAPQQWNVRCWDTTNGRQTVVFTTMTEALAAIEEAS